MQIISDDGFVENCIHEKIYLWADKNCGWIAPLDLARLRHIKDIKTQMRKLQTRFNPICTRVENKC